MLHKTLLTMIMVWNLTLKERFRIDSILSFHQTVHLCLGFIGEPGGHWNSLAKSCELDRVPMTRNRPGECTAVFSLLRIASGRIAPHHTYVQHNWSLKNSKFKYQKFFSIFDIVLFLKTVSILWPMSLRNDA